MTRCAEIESLLFLFRDGELSPEDRARVDVHLRTCSTCVAVMADLRTNDEVLNAYRERHAEEAVPSAAIDAILARVGRIGPHTSTRSRTYSLPDIIRFLDRTLRPALEVVLVAAILVFCIQGVRDARLMTGLEERVTIQSDQALRDAVEADQALARYERGESRDAATPRTLLSSVLQSLLPSAAPMSRTDLAWMLRSASPDARRVARILEHAFTTER
jgi:anti-sigma factor RsiW